MERMIPRADGRLGDYARSQVMLNDYVLIEELAGLERTARRQRLNQLGDAASAYFDQVLPGVLERFRHVVVLTHGPPFREAWIDSGRSLPVGDVSHPNPSRAGGRR
jgi:hypothetical protein